MVNWELIDWEKFENARIAIHCHTEEEAVAFVNMCAIRGYKHAGDGDIRDKTRLGWLVYRGNLCYYATRGFCGDVIIAPAHNDKIRISVEKDGSEPQNEGVSYWDNICEINRRQEKKGLQKYGQTLEDNDTLLIGQRIDHFEEELIDALKYAEHIKTVLSDNLTANDYQRAAMRTASGMQYDISASKNTALLINGVMGLNGEAGECIDIVKKSIFQGHEIDKEHLIEELGDCAWYIAVSAEALGITLEELLNRNIEKLKKRYPEGFDKSRSVNREEAGN